MSPNQPKTPISSFRLKPETRDQLQQIAHAYSTSMTEAISSLAKACAGLAETHQRAASRYRFEAYTSAVGAFRNAMKYERGQILPYEVTSAIDAAVIAANPIIREEQHYETLRLVVDELRNIKADAYVVAHIEGLSTHPA